ncbi:MAG: protein kinase [Planctomycetales bacterium]|nr:protein kinase [Planctomycetales bacterium]MCA9168381.1 protein kinase [Planctomycetales bacterium]
MSELTETPDDSSVSKLAEVIDEISDRLAAGDKIELEHYRRQMPDQADALEEAYASLCQMHRFSRHAVASDNADEVPAPVAVPSPLGDYRLFGEIGRGGMGIVYEAEQMSLGRRVAVKVLPMAALWSARQLDRFRNEARAAALLKHPNIISVHAIGYERGVHFFAMDRIDGGSFAELVEQLRYASPQLLASFESSASSKVKDRPTDSPIRLAPGSSARCTVDQLTSSYSRSPAEYYRAVAELGATVADAIQYAHEQGVTHRDLKPSNLLLDGEGRPWIADFGLAHIQGEASLTMTGDRLGTLRYMSPEQAEGKRILDHRTDVYSLGATLYELLALRPAFDQEDRAHLIRALADFSPPPIRSLAPRVPRDLETIVHKAMSKSPDDRYDSAADLADDLRRFLERRPVKAQPASWLHRLRRWASRNRRLAIVGTTTVLLFTFLAIAGPIAAWKYSRLANSAAEARAASDASRRELQTLLENMLTTTTDLLENTPGIDDAHRSVALDLLDHYRRLSAMDSRNTALQVEVADGFIRLARVINLRFDVEMAEDVLLEAVDLLQSLPETANPEVMLKLSNAYHVLGNINWSPAAYEKSLAICKVLVSDDPENLIFREELGWTLVQMGSCLSQLQSTEAAEPIIEWGIREFGELLKRDSSKLDYQMGLALGCSHLATHQTATGRYLEAHEQYVRALTIGERQKDDVARQVRLQIGFAVMRASWGNNQCYLREYNEGIAQLELAVEQLEQVIHGYPNSVWARVSLGQAQTMLGDAYMAVQRDQDAEAAYRSAIANLLLISAQRSNLTETAVAHYRLGCVLFRVGERDEANAEFREALRISEENDANRKRLWWFVNCPDSGLRDAKRAEHLAAQIEPKDSADARLVGMAHFRAGQWKLAIQSLLVSAVDESKCDPLDAFFLAAAYHQSGYMDEARHWHEAALRRLNSPTSTPQDEVQAARAEVEQMLGLEPPADQSPPYLAEPAEDA